MSNDIDVNAIENADVTNAGKYLVYNVFVGIGDVIVIIILVAVASIILGAFGLSAFMKFGKKAG